jgi:large subunit ribosomal protein L4
VTVAEEKALPTESGPDTEDSGQRTASVVVHDSKGSEVELDPTVFAAPVKPGLHYDAVRQYMAGQRAGTHATKNRALVAGGGRKPWRQKGTGNARVGSRRTPLWRGGGTVFGPQPRDYSYRLPGRMQRGALRSALSLRAGEGRLRIFEDFGLDGPSTRAVLRRLHEWESVWNPEDRTSKNQRVLIVEAAPSDDLYLSTRNLSRVEVVSVTALHCYEVLKANTVLIRRSALAALSEKLSEAGSR